MDGVTKADGVAKAGSVAKARYFPVLDPLRFIASLFVLLAHSATFFDDKIAGKIDFPVFITNAGYFGVVFFYVLSGFLITYLLLDEQKNYGRISVGKFYIRRLLRIWPLYYLIIGLSFLVFPHVWPWKGLADPGSSKSSLLLYLFFLPNLAQYGGTVPATCFQTYTIGYEEQFYFFWPWILKKWKRHLPRILVVLFFSLIFLELLHLFMIDRMPGNNSAGMHLLRGVLTFINYFKLEAFFAGAIAALLFRDGRSKFLNLLSRRAATYIFTFILLALMYFGSSEKPGYVNLVSVVFALLILNLIQQPGSAGRLSAWMVQGGKISYGIYIFHPAIFIFVIRCMAIVHRGSGLPSLGVYILYLAVSLILVLLVSACGYRYFEQVFLRKKTRFQPGM